MRQTIIKIKVFSNTSESPFSEYEGGGEGKGGKKCLFEERRLIERGAYSVFFFNVIVTLYG